MNKDAINFLRERHDEYERRLDKILLTLMHMKQATEEEKSSSHFIQFKKMLEQETTEIHTAMKAICLVTGHN